MKDDYIRYVLYEYFLDKNFDVGFTDSWIDKEDFLEIINESSGIAFSAYGFDASNRYPDIVEPIFSFLISEGAIAQQGDEYAGHWYKLNTSIKNKILKDNLEKNPAFRRVSQVGEEALSRAILNIAKEDGLGVLSSEEAEVITVTRKDKAAPAADRLVPLDHNEAPHKEIAEQLSLLEEEFRTSNSVGQTDAERNRIQTGLEAAKVLWGALELRVSQIKVGILMVVEEAIDAIMKTGKMTARSILVDLIKSFVRNKTGIDI